jgi:hypothetical protein
MTYTGMIVNSDMLFGKCLCNLNGMLAPIVPIIVGTKTQCVLNGYNVLDNNAYVFTRIPKEHVLNKFKKLGGNVKY